MRKLIFMSLLMCSLIAVDSNAAKRRHVFLDRDSRPYYVESIPEEMPIEEGPPEAIDGTIKEVYVDVLKEPEPTLEPIGKYKLTFYCPCRRCSGKWGYKTSSGAIVKKELLLLVQFYLREPVFILRNMDIELCKILVAAFMESILMFSWKVIVNVYVMELNMQKFI